jgi:hypothetical protein
MDSETTETEQADSWQDNEFETPSQNHGTAYQDVRVFFGILAVSGLIIGFRAGQLFQVPVFNPVTLNAWNTAAAGGIVITMLLIGIITTGFKTAFKDYIEEMEDEDSRL